MTVRAYAKVNLTLDVLGKRQDGYHEIKTVMQSISLYDLLDIKKDSSISITTNRSYIPTDRRNLVYTACEKFFAFAGIKGGAKINIKKQIPVSAGLAGGSSDAAATLCALNELYNTGLTVAELCNIGVTIGADVPFCIIGGTALCEGIGEKITPLPPLPKLDVVIAVGGEGLSTPVMYNEIDKINAENMVKVDNEGMISAIKSGDVDFVIKRLANIFEDMCIEKKPKIAQIKSIMLGNGAMGAVMSGSGPSVFGIFSDKTSAMGCAAKLRKLRYFAFYCRFL